jgi:hypothetical protein
VSTVSTVPETRLVTEQVFDCVRNILDTGQLAQRASPHDLLALLAGETPSVKRASRPLQAETTSSILRHQRRGTTQATQ